MILYGFADTEERTLFSHLLGVTGVGPKVALASCRCSPRTPFRRAVVAGDADAIMVVPGVGKKVAARVILDLKDRSAPAATRPSARARWPRSARPCSRWGCPRRRRATRWPRCPPNGDRPVEDLLRDALRGVGKP